MTVIVVIFVTNGSFNWRKMALLSSLSQSCFKLAARHLVTGAALAAPKIPPRLVIKEEDIEEAFLKGSGPGGQKINKTSSAVQLKHLPTGTVVKSQATRSRSQNRSIARRLLADKLEEAEKGAKSRVAIKVEIKRRKKASSSKKARRKYRELQDIREVSLQKSDREPVGNPEHAEGTASDSKEETSQGQLIVDGHNLRCEHCEMQVARINNPVQAQLYEVQGLDM